MTHILVREHPPPTNHSKGFTGFYARHNVNLCGDLGRGAGKLCGLTELLRIKVQYQCTFIGDT